MKKCPYCSEEIQDLAKKCRYCGEWLEEKDLYQKKAVAQQFSAKNKQQKKEEKIIEKIPMQPSKNQKNTRRTIMRYVFWILGILVAIIVLISLFYCFGSKDKIDNVIKYYQGIYGTYSSGTSISNQIEVISSGKYDPIDETGFMSTVTGFQKAETKKVDVIKTNIQTEIIPTETIVIDTTPTDTETVIDAKNDINMCLVACHIGLSECTKTCRDITDYLDKTCQNIHGINSFCTNDSCGSCTCQAGYKLESNTLDAQCVKK